MDIKVFHFHCHVVSVEMYRYVSARRSVIKPMQEAEHFASSDRDKDCVEKRYIDDYIGKKHFCFMLL